MTKNSITIETTIQKFHDTSKDFETHQHGAISKLAEGVELMQKFFAEDILPVPSMGMLQGVETIAISKDGTETETAFTPNNYWLSNCEKVNFIWQGSGSYNNNRKKFYKKILIPSAYAFLNGILKTDKTGSSVTQTGKLFCYANSKYSKTAKQDWDIAKELNLTDHENISETALSFDNFNKGINRLLTGSSKMGGASKLLGSLNSLYRAFTIKNDNGNEITTFNSDAVSFITEAWNDSKGDFRHNNSNADMLLKVYKLITVWLQATNHMHEKNCYDNASNKNLKIDNKAKINSVAFCQFDLNKALAMHDELVAEQKQKQANSK